MYPFCSAFHITFVGSFHTDFFFTFFICFFFFLFFFGGDTIIIDIELLKTHNTFVCISRNDFLHLFKHVFIYFLGVDILDIDIKYFDNFVHFGMPYCSL